MPLRGSSSSKQNADDVLKEFISHSPSSRYTFDSERDAAESEICRDQGPKGRECIMLQMHSKRLFEAMQNFGFFCSLPMDPSRTHMECTPIPKN